MNRSSASSHPSAARTSADRLNFLLPEMTRAAKLITFWILSRFLRLPQWRQPLLLSSLALNQLYQQGQVDRLRQPSANRGLVADDSNCIEIQCLLTAPPRTRRSASTVRPPLGGGRLCFYRHSPLIFFSAMDESTGVDRHLGRHLVAAATISIERECSLPGQLRLSRCASIDSRTAAQWRPPLFLHQ